MAFADVGVRATSLAVSAALLGAAVIAAMTMTISLMQDEDALPLGPIVEIQSPPPVPTPPQAAPLRAPQNPLQEPLFETPWTPLDTSTVADAGFGTAPFVNTEPSLITDPHWRRRPGDLARYYPNRAAARGVEGEVLLDCLVGTSGRLSCSVLEETPAHWGFGEAALRISRDHEMAPALRDGAPVEGRYRMRVPFEMQ